MIELTNLKTLRWIGMSEFLRENPYIIFLIVFFAFMAYGQYSENQVEKTYINNGYVKQGNTWVKPDRTINIVVDTAQ